MPSPAAGLLASCHAGSGKDLWGVDTLTNYPPGGSRAALPPPAAQALPPPLQLWRPSHRACPASFAAHTAPPFFPPASCHAAGRGRLEVPVQANDDGVQTPIALKCQCSDADPRDADTQEVRLGAVT